MKRAILFSAALCVLGAGTAWSLDQISIGTAQKRYFGKITNMTATVISFEPQGGKGPTEIQANEVNQIIFDDSPQALLNAQEAVLKGNYEKAIEELDKETVEDKPANMGQEMVFCRAYCTAELALSGAEDIAKAGKLMFSFIKNAPTNYHYYKACQLMGDICVAADKTADAQKYYAKLADAPWPDYKILAQVALGRAYLAQDNAAAASKAFDDALNNSAPGDLAEIQRTAARIGKARCMVLNGKTDEALHSLGQVIEEMEDKSPEINAMAYNAQGMALRKAGNTRAAIRAFLHVHLQYSTLPDLDAEAVANLATLFTADHKMGHAKEMRDVLANQYPNSRWAKGVK